MLLRTVSLLTLALVITGCASSTTPPLAAAAAQALAKKPVDIRRTTLVVRDIDKSLALYRDALGLDIVYDMKLGGGEPGPDGQPTPPKLRLVLLRANDPFVGLLGLMQRLTVTPPPVGELAKPQAGQAIVLINLTDLEERFPKIRAVPGVTVVNEPEREEYPSPDGKGTIPVIFSAIYDPDGFFIEINRILGKPAGT
jgi:catechol 2,3-dioxygenase-like lactoylglutathione lyase family enzyme